MGYISVVKDGGKKKIIRTRVPDFNKKYIDKKEYKRQSIKNNYDKNIDLKTRKSVNNENNINKNSINIAKSTAYNNKSVIDNNKKIYETVVHNQEVIKNSLVEEEKSVERLITINDFNYLPDYIFNDPIKEDIKPIVVKEEKQIINEEKESKIKNNKKEETVPTITKEDILKEENEKNKITNSLDKNKKDNQLINIENKEKEIEIEKNNEKIKSQDIEVNNVNNIEEKENIIKEADIKEEILPTITEEKKPSFFSRLFKVNKAKDEEKEKDVINIEEVEDANNNEEKVVYNIVEHKDLLYKDEEFKSTIEKEKKNDLNKVLKNEGISSSSELVKGKFYLQLGSSRNHKTAIKTLNKFSGIVDNCFILKTPAEDNESIVYNRIICGHFDTKKDAELSKEKIIKMGHYDVFVFKE